MSKDIFFCLNYSFLAHIDVVSTLTIDALRRIHVITAKEYWERLQFRIGFGGTLS